MEILVSGGVGSWVGRERCRAPSAVEAARHAQAAVPRCASTTRGIAMSDERPFTTTDAGIPAASDEFSMTVGPSGPTVLHDAYVVQKIQQFNRERVPERVVHAKGGGAHGFFEVTEDGTQCTKASFLSEIRNRTPMFARFSTVAGEMGSADSNHDPRGVSLKFYTEAGNFDLVCNNTPTFFVRDASKFQDFIHSQKRS